MHVSLEPLLFAHIVETLGKLQAKRASIAQKGDCACAFEEPQIGNLKVPFSCGESNNVEKSHLHILYSLKAKKYLSNMCKLRRLKSS